MRACEACGIDENSAKIIKYKYKTLLCRKHYDQIIRNGKIYKRTKYDKNEIRCIGDICEMDIYIGESDQKYFGKTYFNKNHLEIVSGLKWGISNCGYVSCNSTKKQLHTYFFERIKGFNVDHINGDKLNNLDENLRHISHQQNCWNKVVKGYFWDKDRSKWQVRISVNRKGIYLGRYDKLEDAIKARRAAKLKYFGEYALIRDN